VVRPRAALGLLLVIDGFLLAMHALAVWLYLDGGGALGRSFEGHSLFNADLEQSVPTWWQQCQLAFGAMLAFAIGWFVGHRNSAERRFWLCAGGLLVLLSMDEATETHERLVAPLREALDINGGVLWFAWVIPAAAVVAVVAVLGIRFGRSAVPEAARRMTMVGAVLFVVGGLGVEMATGAYIDDGAHDYGYFALVALEEGLEMAGASIVIAGLLRSLQEVAPRPAVRELLDSR